MKNAWVIAVVVGLIFVLGCFVAVKVFKFNVRSCYESFYECIFLEKPGGSKIGKKQSVQASSVTLDIASSSATTSDTAEGDTDYEKPYAESTVDKV